MSKQETVPAEPTAKQLTPEQTRCIERTKKAIEFHDQLAKECDAAGIGELARLHDDYARQCRDMLELALRRLTTDLFGGPVIRK